MESTTATSKAPAVDTAARTGSRTALNFWVDLLTALAFAGLLGTSFLMKYILPPGTCDGAMVKVWLGHSRHWWGDIHWVVALALLVLIILHVQLHWGWVTGAWRRLLGSLKSPATWAALVLMAGVMAVPWIIPAVKLDVLEAPDHAAAIGRVAEDVPADIVAPCGVAGLSCADCPASKDRLFGGGCSAAEGGEVSLDVLAEGFENKDASAGGSTGKSGATGGE
jgi:hypothetical protein